MHTTSHTRVEVLPPVGGDELLRELAGGLGQGALDQDLLADIPQCVGNRSGGNLTPRIQPINQSIN